MTPGARRFFRSVQVLLLGITLMNAFLGNMLAVVSVAICIGVVQANLWIAEDRLKRPPRA